jgi:hypothetical protein
MAALPLVAAGIGISILPASLQHMNIPGDEIAPQSHRAPD